MEHGFPLVWRPETGPPPAYEGRENYKSALLETDQIDDQIRGLVQVGKVAGPFSKKKASRMGLVISPIGAVPKKGTAEVRMILDLSIHTNKYLAPMECPLPTVDDAVKLIKDLGGDCWLIKIDLSKGFLQLPVARRHQYMLGFKWKKQYYHFQYLPFGLNASPGLFCWFTRALKQILWKEGIPCEVYVDDFLLVIRAANSPERDKERAMAILEQLGVILNQKKTEGPEKQLTFVGININTVNQSISLPEDKVQDIRDVMAKFEGKKRVSYKLFMKLVGKLSFAAKCVRAARSFLRRMWDQVKGWKLRGVKKKQVKLGTTFWEDFKWWKEMLDDFVNNKKAVSFWQTDSTDLYFDSEVATDASGYGLGAVWGQEHFSYCWNARQKQNSINWKELRTVILAAEKWGNCWNRKRILIHSDNSTTVSLVNKGSSKKPHLMKLVRRLHELAAKGGFEFKARHIPGERNVRPDWWSRQKDAPVLKGF